MKKTYIKPSLYVENFSLTQSVATGCTAQKNDLGKPSQAYEGICGWDFAGQTFFTAGINPDCTAGEADFLCYNAPNGSIMFAS